MRELQCRALTVDSLFDLCALLEEIGVEPLLSALRAPAGAQEEAGRGVAVRLLELLLHSLPAQREGVYRFLAGCLCWSDGSEVTPRELRALSPLRLLQALRQLSAQEGLADFFAGPAVQPAMAGQDFGSCCTATMEARSAI